ncbi:hypothetical protein H9P43_009326 [Blastocladiella emersonii ATCC 22665]|nr:hypothetical protein H9P43_009326 [Blastocladiella emersonii ATCC 22665]
MGNAFSSCFGGPRDAPGAMDENRPLLDPQGAEDAQPIPSYMQEEEALKRIVQKACDSFIDIGSATTRITDKLPYGCELPPTSNSLAVNFPAQLPLALAVDAELPVQPVAPDADEAKLITQNMDALLRAMAGFTVQYQGSVVVSLS